MLAWIIRLLTAIGILAFTASLPSLGGPKRETVSDARELYYRGIYGDKSAAQRADKMFSNLYEENPKDPTVGAYYGSLRLLEAQRTWALWKKNSLSKTGITLLDQAVSKAPENLELRFVRAATERELPSFFGRKEQVATDLQFITERASKAVEEGQFEGRLAAASFFFYGEWYREHDQAAQAREAWQMAVRIAPNSNGGRKSAEALEKLGERG